MATHKIIAVFTESLSIHICHMSISELNPFIIYTICIYQKYVVRLRDVLHCLRGRSRLWCYICGVKGWLCFAGEVSFYFIFLFLHPRTDIRLATGSPVDKNGLVGIIISGSNFLNVQVSPAVTRTRLPPY